jgi:hypothetical protein
MWSGKVVSIPGTGVAWLDLGGRGCAGDPPVHAATPSTFLTHPGSAIAAAAANSAAQRTLDGSSVTRKG